VSSELQAGDAFAGHRIDAVAGRGGMGVVYRATQLDLDRTVALKLITPSLAQDPLFRERFIRETRVAAGIDHPHVIPVFYAGESDGRLYLAMRYVTGEDLRTLVRREGPLDPARAARIIAQVASALDAAHASGIVHRDVKPANILLGGGEHAYLTDFGLTKRVHSASGMTQAGGWVGTLGFVAPEQIRGGHVDARADVYALGCVLHHALTGRPPHQRDSDEATMWAHLHEPPPPLGDQVPPALGDVLVRALAKDPGDRFPSAGDLGRALLAEAGLDHSVVPERMVATGAAAPAGPEPPVDQHTEASPVPAPTHAPASAPSSPTAHVPGAAARKVQRTRPQTAFLVIAWISISLVVGLVALLLFVPDDPVLTGTTSGTTNPRLPEDRPAQPRVVGSVPAGRSPNDVVVTRQVVWVSSSQDPTLTRIPTTTGLRPSKVPVGLGVQALATGYDTLWVAKQKTHSLLRLDLGTGRPRGPAFRLPDGLPVALGTGQGGIWVAMRGPGMVVRVNPRTGAVDKRVPLPRGVQDMAVGEGGVWVVDRQGRGVTRIDPQTTRTRFVPVGNKPKGIAVGEGYVWVCISEEDLVQRIDPKTDRKAGRFRTGDAPTGIDVGGGNVWVTNGVDGSVTQIAADPREPRAVATVSGLVNPFAIAARGPDVWVTDLVTRSANHLRVGR
jgi:serine/threonine protein kinase/streptogramin lyase